MPGCGRLPALKSMHVLVLFFKQLVDGGFGMAEKGNRPSDSCWSSPERAEGKASWARVAQGLASQ